IKFFLYTLFGSVFMLLGFLALYFKSNPHTFDIIQLQQIAATRPIVKSIQVLIFTGLFLGFAIKVPMWPFHTWLPDAHTEAPTVGSVLLAGILLKMGAYGFIRIALPILPQAARIWAPAIGILAAIAIVYASLGLPGLAGFWGEVTALLSSYSPAGALAGHVTLFRTLMVFGGIGTILTAGYFLWTLQRVNLGTLPELWKEKALPDVTRTEWLAWAPLLVGILFLGLYPRIVFGTTNEAVNALARLFVH